MRATGTFEVIGAWEDDGSTFTAIIGPDVVVSPDMDEDDKALLAGVTAEELEEARSGNGLFTILDYFTVSTLN
jgi:hypothetical protein